MSLKANISKQRGVGMVEVVVATLMLAIGVLGYSILQVRAVEATSEGLVRSQASLILRGLGDQIRMNNAMVSVYNNWANLQGKTTITYSDYQTTMLANSAITTAPTATSCQGSSTCTLANVAVQEANQAAAAAFSKGILLNLVTCPGDVPVKDTSGNVISPARMCLVAAWGKFTPTLGSGTADCMTTAGAYNTSANTPATCLVQDAY